MIENDDKLLDDLYACIGNISASVEVVDDIHRELSKYKMSVCHFPLKEAVRNMDDVAAGS